MPNVFEINEDEIDKDECCLWILCNVFFPFYIKEKFVGPVKNLQEQQIVCVAGPTQQFELALRPGSNSRVTLVLVAASCLATEHSNRSKLH